MGDVKQEGIAQPSLPTSLAAWNGVKNSHHCGCACKDIVWFIIYSVELMIEYAKFQRVHNVGYPEQLGRGGGSSMLVETLVEFSVI